MNIRATTGVWTILAVGAIAFGATGWRTDGTGMYAGANPPTEWSPTTNIAWKLPLPEWGNATPVIVGDKVFLTAEPNTLLCVSRSQRKILWQKTLPYKGPLPKTHKVSGYASATPATDGQRVAAVFGTGDVACYDTAGRLQWSKTVQRPEHKWGHSASPVLIGDTLIVAIRDVFALDITTGAQKWKAPSKAHFGTPVAAKIGTVDIVATTNGEIIRVDTGTVLATGLATLTYAAPLVHEGVVYYIEHGGKAIRLPDSVSDDMKFEVLWTTTPHKDRYYASPVIAKGLLFACTRYGQYSVIEAGTGEILASRKLEFPKTKAFRTVYPSLVLAGGRIYLSHDSGTTLVLAPSAEYKEIARNTLEPFRSTPVVVDNRFYIRTLGNLYCIGP